LGLLKKIQALQLTSIPYENLSLHWRPIQQASFDSERVVGDAQATPPTFSSPPFSLSASALFQKLVLARRGGYCLELNLLQALGFKTVNVSVKVVFNYDQISERLQREIEFAVVKADGDDEGGLT